MGNRQVNCEARVNVDESEETKEEIGPQMVGTKLTEEDSKKIKKRKQGNARQRKYRESKKNDPATKAKKKEENSKGSEKKATKEIADKIRKAFEENVNEETVGNGVAFIVEGVVQISPQSVVNLKVSLSGSPWSNLKQPGRYYMAEPPKKTDDKGYKLGRLEEALKIVFRGKKRKDGTRVLDGWHVNPLGFIQHLQTCTQKQGYHVDDKDARNNMIQWMQSKKSNATEKLEYFHYSGYSVFVGLEIKNYLAIANCSDDGETISDERWNSHSGASW
jgi:hypothetical protein